MNFSRISTACGHSAGKILSAAALLLALGTSVETLAQLQAPVQVGPGVPPNTIPIGTMPIAPTLGVSYTDPILPQLWLWNTAAPTMPTIRLQNASALPSTPPGGSLWGLARPSDKLSSLACNSGTDPDVVFKADGDTKDLIITNLGTRSGGIRFATTVAPTGPSPKYTEKERLSIMNNGNVTITPDAGGKLLVNGKIHLTGSLMPNGSSGLAGQVLTSQGTGSAPTWTTVASSTPATDVAWLIDGNNNTDGTNFLGTTVGQPLIMKTDNTERMRVTKDGWVGIGTNDPARPFEVKGGGQVIGQFTSEVRTTLDILSTANNGAGNNEGNAQIRFINEYAGGTENAVLHGSWMAGMDAEDAYKFKIAPINDSRWLGASTFVIQPNGRVGIGTNTPDCQLHVRSDYPVITGLFSGASHTLLDIHSEGTTPATGNAILRLYNKPVGAGTSNGNWMVGMDAEDEYKFKIAPLEGATWGSASTFVVKPDGKIGVGTNDPKDNLHVWGTMRIGEKGVVGLHNDYKLAVDGKAVAKEFVVLEVGDWADFVFDESYQLMELEEVAKSIEVNKHLPGIPSAVEVKQNGMNVAEIQVKLLQKIEELTLYVIEQQKQIKALEAKLK